MLTQKDDTIILSSVYSSLAQLVEHAAVNRRVVGSSPTGGANFSLAITNKSYQQRNKISRLHEKCNKKHQKLKKSNEIYSKR